MKHGGGDGGGHQGGRRVQAGLSLLGERWSVASHDVHLLAMDDTDNLDSPGTGFRARELALLLAERRLATPIGITRHQLLVHEAIPYTSHNSSACLVLRGVRDPTAVFSFSCTYLQDAAAPGSDAALVLVERARASEDMLSWGQRAKREVLTLQAARALAGREHDECGLLHAELTGTGGGLIGSLAAVGLNAHGHDGRLLWLRGIRELAGQRLAARELEERIGLQVQTCDGLRPTAGTADAGDIELGDWPRAVYRGHVPVLLVENNNEQERGARWRCIARERVKQLSS